VPGSEAELYIPRALLLLVEEKGRQVWRANWENAPLYVFLPWAAQMFSLMGTPEGDALVSCLEVTPTF
jgi:hypothetical protein